MTRSSCCRQSGCSAVRPTQSTRFRRRPAHRSSLPGPTGRGPGRFLEGAVGSEANVECSRTFSGKLEKAVRNLLGAEIGRIVVDEVYDYDVAVEQAYDPIDEELDRDDEVWVNASSIPRPVSVAAANHRAPLEHRHGEFADVATTAAVLAAVG